MGKGITYLQTTKYKFSVVQVMISVFDRVGDSVRKVQNTGHHHIHSPFPQCFQRCFLLKVIKNRDSVVKD